MTRSLDDAVDQVAFGEQADDLGIARDHHRADMLVGHEYRGVPGGLVFIQQYHLALHYFADRCHDEASFHGKKRVNRL